MIGHCYYMESGNEETNEVSFNLGAHIHQIGHFDDIRGQFTEQAFNSAQLGGAAVPGSRIEPPARADPGLMWPATW